MISFALSNAIESLNGGQFVSPGFGTHAVRVIDSYELIFVTRGTLDLFEGERTFHLGRNQTLLLYPGVRHGGLLPYAPDVNFYWVHFRLSDAEASGTAVDVPKTTTVTDPEGLTELFCRFISDQESGILDSFSAAHLVALMVCIACEHAVSSRTGRPSGARRLDREGLAEAVDGFINANCTGPLTASSIANVLRYNPDYLERVFRARYEMSITDALHQKRIGRARASLNSEPGRNINEISFECGYSNPRYFRRIFKRMTGLTPREFRTLYARTHINTH
jgi:AraC-like DNA-binding protein